MGFVNAQLTENKNQSLSICTESLLLVLRAYWKGKRETKQHEASTYAAF